MTFELPPNYRHRLSPLSCGDRPGDTPRTASSHGRVYQRAVYDLAVMTATREREGREMREYRRADTTDTVDIVDVGCGLCKLGDSGFCVLGVDTPEMTLAAARTWAGKDYPVRFVADDLETCEHAAMWNQNLATYVCADVIEHLVDPTRLLASLAARPPGTHLVISTPDRGRVPGASRTGPPKNKRHVREWTIGEFSRLLLPHLGRPVLEGHVRAHSGDDAAVSTIVMMY